MQTDKENVAFGSIAASAGLTIAKAAVGLMTGSLAILSEAAHSFLDLIATIMTYYAVRISGKPADDEHHYGHGKVESVTAFITTSMLFILSAVVIWEAGKRLLGEEAPHVVATIPTFAVIIGLIVIDFWRARLLTRVAKATRSEALHADALHFSSDMWSSLAVLVGLGGIALGFAWADAAAALVVAIFILIAGLRLARRTVETLTDTAPPGSAETLTALAARVSGVVAVERVRAREVGHQLFVEITAAVSRTLPIDRVNAIKDAVASAVHGAYPGAEVSVTTEPRALDNETMIERVNVIARNRALAVHHVTVHNLQDRVSVSLDLEVDGDLSLAEAHDIADGLEKAIEAEIGNGVEVETHIEPLQTEDVSGRDATQARVGEVGEALAAIAGAIGTIRQVHDVRVRATRDGEIVNFHCRVDPRQTVHDVHEKVDELERALRGRWPSIRRVIGHAEPLAG